MQHPIRMSGTWHPRCMPLVALTGGIASGKSTIARRLAEHGAVVVDADQIVRDVQQPGSPVLAAIAAEFGERMLRPDGSLDRAALGAAVFGDPDAVDAAQRDRASGGARRVRTAVRRGLRRRPATRSSSTTCRCSSRRASATPGSSSSSRTRPPRCDASVSCELRGHERGGCRRPHRIAGARRGAPRIADVVIDTSGSLEDTLDARSMSSGRRCGEHIAARAAR